MILLCSKVYIPFATCTHVYICIYVFFMYYFICLCIPVAVVLCCLRAEGDWDQKASAAFHTKNSLKFLKSLFLRNFLWEITKASRQLPHCHNGQSAPAYEIIYKKSGKEFEYLILYFKKFRSFLICMILIIFI
jgi:hypothetical protein